MGTQQDAQQQQQWERTEGGATLGTLALLAVCLAAAANLAALAAPALALAAAWLLATNPARDAALRDDAWVVLDGARQARSDARSRDLLARGEVLKVLGRTFADPVRRLAGRSCLVDFGLFSLAWYESTAGVDRRAVALGYAGRWRVLEYAPALRHLGEAALRQRQTPG